MLIGIDRQNHLWIELDDEDVCAATTNEAKPGCIRLSRIKAASITNFTIDHTDLIKALVAMRDKKDEAPWMDVVRAYIRDKNALAAIRTWRQHTGLGLKDAKDAVDKLRQEEGL